MYTINVEGLWNKVACLCYKLLHFKYLTALLEYIDLSILPITLVLYA